MTTKNVYLGGRNNCYVPMITSSVWTERRFNPTLKDVGGELSWQSSPEEHDERGSKFAKNSQKKKDSFQMACYLRTKNLKKIWFPIKAARLKNRKSLPRFPSEHRQRRAGGARNSWALNA